MHNISRDTMLRILRDASEQGAVEVHFKVPNRPLLRLENGTLVPTRLSALTPADTKAAVFALCALGHLELPVAQITDHEFSFGINGLGRYRAYIYRQRGSLGAVVRRVISQVPPLTELGLDDSVDRLVGVPGLTLVSGVHRNEVLHALIHGYNARSRAALWILETPLTYLHRDAMSAISHREVGTDLPSYATGIQQAMRLGADLIAVGDIPDADTAERVLEAAERQVPVIAAVGSPDAAQTTWWIHRLFYGQQREDVERRLDAVLKAVVSVTDASRPEVWVGGQPTLSAVGG
jgi:twitching motility protein PilT